MTYSSDGLHITLLSRPNNIFYILLCQHVWVVGLDYNEPPLTQTDTTSSCSRDSHREWSLGADIGQIQLKVLCWGFVQLSVSPLWPGGSNTSGLSWLDVEVSRLCEVPSRQSSESIATWKDWLSGRWGVVLVGKFSTLTFSSGSLGRWAVWPGLSPQEESPHPPAVVTLWVLPTTLTSLTWDKWGETYDRSFFF